MKPPSMISGTSALEFPNRRISVEGSIVTWQDAANDRLLRGIDHYSGTSPFGAHRSFRAPGTLALLPGGRRDDRRLDRRQRRVQPARRNRSGRSWHQQWLRHRRKSDDDDPSPRQHDHAGPPARRQPGQHGDRRRRRQPGRNGDQRRQRPGHGSEGLRDRRAGRSRDHQRAYARRRVRPQHLHGKRGRQRRGDPQQGLADPRTRSADRKSDRQGRLGDERPVGGRRRERRPRRFGRRHIQRTRRQPHDQAVDDQQELHRRWRQGWRRWRGSQRNRTLPERRGRGGRRVPGGRRGRFKPGEGGEGANAIGHFPNGGDGGRGGSSGDGGGIYNAGTVTIDGSTISGNFTGLGGEGGTGAVGTGEVNEFSPGKGGDGGEGGNSGVQYEKNSGYNSDLLDGGGGIYNGGSLTMTNSTISGNATEAGGTGGGSGAGGGPKQYGGFGSRRRGRAGTGGGGGRGGGLFTGGGFTGHSPVNLTNVTIYGNRTGDGGTGGGGGGGEESTLGGGVGGWGGDGGGIWAEGAKSGSEVLLSHVTIAGNGLGAGGLTGNSAVPNRGGCCGERGLGAGISTGGRYDGSGSSVFERNSIIANNGSNLAGDANCYQRYFPTYIDIVDQGGNVTWNDTTCPGKVADPLLGPLANNGGLPETGPPGAGGSAIGTVPAGSCTVHEDQRGLPRPGTGKTNCDAGAVETQAGESSPPTGNERDGERPGGGSGNNAAAGGSAGAAGGGGPTPTPRPLQCKKGFKKKTVKGRPKCVKLKKAHRHHKP